MNTRNFESTNTLHLNVQTGAPADYMRPAEVSAGNAPHARLTNCPGCTNRDKSMRLCPKQTINPQLCVCVCGALSLQHVYIYYKSYNWEAGATARCTNST